MPDTNSSGRGGTTVTLPWPSTRLSPNARLHWSRKSQFVKAARETSWALTRGVVGPVPPRWPAAKLDMVLCPPDKRRRDRDTIIASLKAATDGIADALGTDDSKFTTTYSMGQPVKGGAVFVTIQGTA